MSLLDDLKKKVPFLKNTEKDENQLPNEDVGETEQEEIHIADEGTPEDGAKTVKGQLIKGIAFGLGAFAVAILINNLMDKPPVPGQGKESTDLSANTITANPAQGIPDNYADIAKYQARNDSPKPIKPVNAERNLAAQQGSNNYSQGNYSYQPTSTNYVANNTYDDRQAEQETARIAASPILFDVSKLSGYSAAVNSANAGPVPIQETNDSYDNGFTLYAGTIIPATLLTGVTSEVNNGDVVAQVRQDVYDSLTGMHLLIPQGSRLIGVSGAAGSRGNKCIGVAFKRIIFPNGFSVQLPDQKAIDGTGFPGLRDKYDDHSSTLYRSAFLGALLAAAAQSATGDSNGYENRSPGEEAVSGAVAEVLDTAHTIVERDANMSPTITIRPGAQFSVFINADFSLMEYLH